MNKSYNTKNFDAIRIRFELSNNLGFIPLYTKVFLDLQNGINSNDPIFTTPMHLTDASIPLTPMFKHNKGLLFFETYISFKSLNTLPNAVIMEKAKKLIFKYHIEDPSGANQEFNTYDFGPTIIKNKELIYFVALIDLI
ncbi:hypothetical protein [Flavobacterium cellulosilyticum]|uniref:Uncharacterized protein n=1 Tax=Flavobacterium cellulosilyticum TaxID=2541731 RepID=A0A4R5CAJ3_9FLAO|nr:hypothetical protein [Flavobacterium cellulosilyticum]TDD94114.1 hypothetical protein E0F76_17640 [Flavobacterium cellulosilyticum]